MKRFCLFSISLVLGSCSLGPEVAYKGHGQAMGEIPMNLTVYSHEGEGPGHSKAFLDLMNSLGKKMTIWDKDSKDSEIAKLNAGSGKTGVSLSQDSLTVIRTALDYARLSNGALDIALGPLVKAWGVAGGKPRVPSDQEIQALLPLTHLSDVEIQDSIVFLKKPGMMLDLGSVAKGYAADLAKDLMVSRGVSSAMIDVGGNLYLLGQKPLSDGISVKWKVGIQDPESPHGAYLGIIRVADISMVTSGDYERVFTGPDGKRYHHILDPATGYPAVTDVRGVTIFSKSSIQADCLSTATFILGHEKGMALVKSLPGVEALFITKDKKIYLSPGIQDSFELTNPSYTVVK